MKRNLTAIFRDRPLLIGLAVLIFLVIRVWSHASTDQRTIEGPLGDALATLSKGETAELRIGPDVAIELDPAFDAQGEPIDLEKTASALVKALPTLLSQAEARYGPNDPRTIQARFAMVSWLLREKRLPDAAKLAATNFAIATGPGPVTAEQLLAAVHSVLDTIPPDATRDFKQKEFRDLLLIIDGAADSAPDKAAELYVAIGGKQLESGFLDDAPQTFKTVVSLGGKTEINQSKLGAAHIGLSKLAWRAGDCETALSHAIKAYESLEEASIGIAPFKTLLAKMTAPMIDQCGTSSEFSNRLRSDQ